MNSDDKLVFVDAEVAPQILSIIEKASEYVIFVTPYLRLWNHRQNAIEEAASRRVKITFIVRVNENDETKRKDLDWLISHNVEVLVAD